MTNEQNQNGAAVGRSGSKALLEGKPTEPLSLLREIEAYLCFRLTGENPSVPKDDMTGIRDSIRECLTANGSSF